MNTGIHKFNWQFNASAQDNMNTLLNKNIKYRMHLKMFGTKNTMMLASLYRYEIIDTNKVHYYFLAMLYCYVLHRKHCECLLNIDNNKG